MVVRGSADRDRKSGLIKNKTIDAIVACKGAGGSEAYGGIWICGKLRVGAGADYVQTVVSGKLSKPKVPS